VAAKQFAEELEDLNESERHLLAQSLDDIVRDTPSTSLAVSRVKRAIGKLKKPSAEFFSKVVTDIATESVKKLLLGP
jgi:hypothetical protein